MLANRLFTVMLLSFFVSATADSLTAQAIIHVPLYTFHGDGPDDRFGWSVSGVGDVNGDEKADLIVGAPSDDNGPSNGSARVFSGSDGSVLYTVNGDIGDGDHFGNSVSGAGDVNGDGTPDLIVGANRDDNSGTDSGSARVLSGIDGSVLYTFYGDSDFDFFGTSVSGAGDINGDGRADLIIGAPSDPTGNGCGSARVLSGIDGSVLYTFCGDNSEDRFGTSVSGTGDVNGDGTPDLIVGARNDDNNAFDSGSARVLSGIDGSVLYTFDGDNQSDHFGTSVSGAGDVNGDGTPDLIVGANHDFDFNFGSGKARVLSGSDGSVLHTFNGYFSVNDGFGRSVSGAGDVNGDGFADLIVGAYLSNDSSGRARVISGSDGSALYKFNGEGVNDWFGRSVSSAGDVNGDGIDDFIVGAAFGGANGGGYARVFVSNTIQPSNNPIAWETPITIYSDADIKNLGGPIHLAADFNPPEAFNPDQDLLFVQGDFDGVINGIQFTSTGTDQSIPGLLTTNFRRAANASTFLNGAQGRFYRGLPTGDADLDNLLDSHSYNTATRFGLVTIEGLNIGTEYQVQLIGIADGRGSHSTVIVSNNIGQLTGPTLARYLYQTVTGRFTADSTSQVIFIEPFVLNGPGLSGIVVQSVPEVLLGDCNLNGEVDFLDIAAFVSILSGGDYLAEADINEDGVVTFLDIQHFVALLSS